MDNKKLDNIELPVLEKTRVTAAVAVPEIVAFALKYSPFVPVVTQDVHKINQIDRQIRSAASTPDR